MRRIASNMTIKAPNQISHGPKHLTSHQCCCIKIKGKEKEKEEGNGEKAEQIGWYRQSRKMVVVVGMDGPRK